MKQRHISVVMELNWPYKRHYGIFAGIQRYAREEANWSFDLLNYPEVQLANGERFDGVIGRISGDCYDAVRNASIPVVNVWLESPVYPQAPSVCVDFRAAGRMAAEHLIARGLRRLAHFGYAGTEGSRNHFEGMQEVAEEHGYPCTRHTVSRHFDESRKQWTKFIAAVDRIQSAWKPPIGFGFFTDQLCRSVASTCLNSGWKIPEQLALVSCGNDEIICNAIEPTLSSIDMGDAQSGYEAARLLDRLMQGDDQPEGAVFTPPEQLLVRRSSDVFAVSDSKVAEALRFMADFAGEQLSVPIIARHVGLGRQSLERRFRQHVGRAINDELIRLRVEIVKRLLVESDEPIKSISAKAGFGSTVSLHTMFKRHTDLTPQAYREKHRPRPAR